MITFKIIECYKLEVEAEIMRNAVIFFSAIMLLCLYARAYGGSPGDIAEPSISAPNMDMPKPLAPGPNMNMPKTEATSFVKPKNDLTSSPNHSGNLSFSRNKAHQIQQKTEAINVSGKWSINLDGIDRSIDLTLWPSAGDIGIMGFGAIQEEGRENSVTASGSITDKEFRIIAKLASPEHAGLKYDECDIDLLSKNETLSGTYILRSNGQFLEKGNATVEAAPNS